MLETKKNKGMHEVRTLPCPARDYGRDGRVFRCNGAARGVGIVTWGISRNPLRPGALVTAGDVCHLHPDRAAAERCGALMGGAPDLVRLEKHTARVYRVLWSLSDVAGGELETGAPAGTATRKAPRRRSELAGERPHKRLCGGARRLGAADGGRSMTATRADVERAVSGRPGRGPRNGRVWDGDVRARSRRWFKACVPDDEIPGLGGAARESTTGSERHHRGEVRIGLGERDPVRHQHHRLRRPPLQRAPAVALKVTPQAAAPASRPINGIMRSVGYADRATACVSSIRSDSP